MKTVIVTLTLLLAGVSAALITEVRADRPAALAPRAPAVAVEVGPEAPQLRPVPPPIPNVRAEVVKVVEARAPEIHTVGDVDHYLGELEAQARRKHQVTALEVEPGILAIRQMQSELGPDETMRLTADFTQKMARLSAEARRAE
jgi:hypothetical protein